MVLSIGSENPAKEFNFFCKQIESVLRQDSTRTYKSNFTPLPCCSFLLVNRNIVINVQWERDNNLIQMHVQSNFPLFPFVLNFFIFASFFFSFLCSFVCFFSVCLLINFLVLLSARFDGIHNLRTYKNVLILRANPIKYWVFGMASMPIPLMFGPDFNDDSLAEL